MKPNIRKIIETFAAKRYIKLNDEEMDYFVIRFVHAKGVEKTKEEQGIILDKINHDVDMSYLEDIEHNDWINHLKISLLEAGEGKDWINHLIEISLTAYEEYKKPKNENRKITKDFINPLIKRSQSKYKITKNQIMVIIDMSQVKYKDYERIYMRYELLINKCIPEKKLHGFVLEQLVSFRKKSPPKLEILRRNNTKIKTNFRTYFITMLRTLRIDASKEGNRNKKCVADETSIDNHLKYSRTSSFDKMDCDQLMRKLEETLIILDWIKTKDHKFFFKVCILIWCDLYSILREIMLLRKNMGVASDQRKVKAIQVILDEEELFKALKTKEKKHARLTYYYQLLFNRKYTGEIRKKLWNDDILGLILAINPNLPQEKRNNRTYEKILKGLLDCYFNKEKK